jgi:hypothetical protein
MNETASINENKLYVGRLSLPQQGKIQPIRLERPS